MTENLYQPDIFWGTVELDSLEAFYTSNKEEDILKKKTEAGDKISCGPGLAVDVGYPADLARTATRETNAT